jgi:hypothetical protein
MVMGMLAVRNLLGDQHDVWTIDHPDEYLEELHEASTPSFRIDGRSLASTQAAVSDAGPCARGVRAAVAHLHE